MRNKKLRNKRMLENLCKFICFAFTFLCSVGFAIIHNLQFHIVQKSNGKLDQGICLRDYVRDFAATIKGYLCYKLITFQYVPPEAQVKNLFIS